MQSDRSIGNKSNHLANDSIIQYQKKKRFLDDDDEAEEMNVSLSLWSWSWPSSSCVVAVMYVVENVQFSSNNSNNQGHPQFG